MVKITVWGTGNLTQSKKEGMSLPVNLGPVGSQIDEAIGEFLPGGGNQIEMLVPRENIMDYLEVVGDLRNID